jgi:transcriptional regulator with XRE-family HTH domain
MRTFGHNSDQMSESPLSPVLERQLLLQLGDRLQQLRKAHGLGTVEMAARAGITRNTLRAVESGDPGPSIGTYVRVMSILGVGGELALLANGAFQASVPGSASARSRRAASVVQVRISGDETSHRLQDMQSLALHTEAVRLAKKDKTLVTQALDVVNRWLATGDARSASLWREWQSVLSTGAWRKVLGRTRRAQQLRQASPLVVVLSDDVRQDILEQVRQLRSGIVINSTDAANPGALFAQKHSGTP